VNFERISSEELMVQVSLSEPASAAAQNTNKRGVSSKVPVMEDSTKAALRLKLFLLRE
jgi:hypothetical protein